MADHDRPHETVPVTSPAALPSSVAAIQGSLEQVLRESEYLRRDVKSAEAERKRENRISLALLGLLSLFVIVVGAIAWQNNSIAQQTADTNARMADCTTPGGKCYAEGNKRTGGAINALIATQIAALECARLYPGLSGDDYNQKLESCVYARVGELMKSGAGLPATPVSPETSVSPSPPVR